MRRLNPNKTLVILAAAIGGIFANQPASAELLVYEGFQYNETGDELIAKPDDDGGVDATGLSGTWADASANNGVVNDMFLKSGNLVFGDLVTTGGHIGFLSNANNDRYHRPLSAEAQAGIAGGSEIWFSVLFEKLQNNFSAGEGGFALANQVVETPRIFENKGDDGLAGFGFGPTTAGNDLKPYAWDGATQVAGDMSISAPPANGSSNTSGSNFGDVRLIVGHISFDTGAGGADRYTLYDYQLSGGSIADGGLGTPIATTIEVEVDQSAIGTLNLTRQVNLNWDEVRIGTTLESVLAVEAAAPFAITEIDYDADSDGVTLTWRSKPGTLYRVVTSPDLGDWSRELVDSIGAAQDENPADGDHITFSFDLALEGLDAEAELFFRIEEQQ